MKYDAGTCLLFVCVCVCCYVGFCMSVIACFLLLLPLHSFVSFCWSFLVWFTFCNALKKQSSNPVCRCVFRSGGHGAVLFSRSARETIAAVKTDDLAVSARLRALPDWQIRRLATASPGDCSFFRSLFTVLSFRCWICLVSSSLFLLPSLSLISLFFIQCTHN